MKNILELLLKISIFLSVISIASSFMYEAYFKTDIPELWLYINIGFITLFCIIVTVYNLTRKR